MKRVIILIAGVLLFGSFFSEAGAGAKDRFERKRVAVVPVDDVDRLTSILENALSSDARFDFFDENLVPEILKEWERRQLGLTEEDDTRELYIMNVDYLVTLTNARIDSVYKDNLWESTLRAQLRVTFVQEGGRTEVHPVNARATDPDRTRSRIRAVEAVQSPIETAAQKIFPIESLIYESSYTSIKLLRGSDAGVKRGQRYIIREERQVDAGNRKVTRTSDAAFVQIDHVDREDSTGYIIFGDSFDINNAIAVEQHYSNIAIEVYGGMMNYRMAGDSGMHDFKGFDAIYGFKVFYGDRFQLGWGLNTDWPGPGRFTRVSFTDLTVRYNHHLVRRFYLFAEGGGSLEFAFTSENVRSKEGAISGYGQIGGPDEYGNYEYDAKEDIRAWTISGNLGLGVRFITGYNTYIYCAAHYVFAKNFSSWKLWELDDETASSAEQRLYEASISTYDDYVERFSAAGPRFTMGFGFYF